MHYALPTHTWNDTAGTPRQMKNYDLWLPMKKTDHYGRYIIKRKEYSTGTLLLTTSLTNCSICSFFLSISFIHIIMRSTNYTNFFNSSVFPSSFLMDSCFVWSGMIKNLQYLQYTNTIAKYYCVWRTGPRFSWVSQHRNLVEKTRRLDIPVHGLYGEATFLYVSPLKIGRWVVAWWWLSICL